MVFTGIKFKKVSEVSSIIMGQSPPSDSYNNNSEGLPFFQGKTDFGEVNPIERVYCNNPKKVALNKDILISVRAPVGDVNIANQECCIGRGLAAIRSNEDIINYKYLYYYLCYKKNVIENMGTGSTFKAISKKDIENFEVVLFNLKSQEKIVEILDLSKQLINKRNAQLAAIFALRQSVFFEMFGDPVNNEKKWEKKKLPDFVTNDKHSIKRGPFGGALKKEIFVDKGYLVYEQYHAINDDFSMARYFITPEKFNEMKAFKVKPGDLIISCSGVTLGRIAEIPKNAPDGIINQALLKLTLNNNIMDNVFFKHLFRNERIQEVIFGVSRGSGIPNFPSMDTIKSIGFICPPINLQNKFMQIITEIDRTESKIKESLSQLQNHFQVLMHKAFNGELFND